MPDNGRKTNSEIWERLARLETEVERIRTNDLIHIEKKLDANCKKIDAIEKKLAMAAGALVIINLLWPIIVQHFI